MEIEHNDRIEIQHKVETGHFSIKHNIHEVKHEDDARLKNNWMVSHQGAFILSNSKGVLKLFIRINDGNEPNCVFYMDMYTGSLYSEKKTFGYIK